MVRLGTMAGDNGELLDQPSDADDDEALRYAIALSLQDQQEQPSRVNKSQEAEPEAGEKQNVASGLQALDRKAMERERLRRLAAKRPRPPSNRGDNGDDDDDVVEVPPPPKRLQRAVPAGKVPVLAAGASSGASLQFPDGVVKRTWAYGYPRMGDDIKIEEVLMKDKLELAVLSSFQWDDEWLLSKVDIRKTKLFLIAFARDETQVWDQNPVDRQHHTTTTTFTVTLTTTLAKRDARERSAKRPILLPTYEWAGIDALQAAAAQVPRPPSDRGAQWQPGLVRLGGDGCDGKCRYLYPTERAALPYSAPHATPSSLTEIIDGVCD